MSLKVFLTGISILLILLLEIIFSVSGYWVLSSLSLIILAGLVLLILGKENSALIVIFVSSIIVDIFAFRIIGAQLIIFLVACILFLILARSVVFFDSRSRVTKIFMMFCAYLIAYFGYLFVGDNITLIQAFLAIVINTIVFAILILIFGRNKEAQHVLRF